jgi:hypothetical protein
MKPTESIWGSTPPLQIEWNGKLAEWIDAGRWIYRNEETIQKLQTHKDKVQQQIDTKRNELWENRVGPSRHQDSRTRAHEDQLALENRRAEVLKWKEENPGNIWRDPDLLRIDAEINKTKETAKQTDNFLTPEFMSGAREYMKMPHKTFIEAIRNTLDVGQFPQFPWKDGLKWSIIKLEWWPNGREKITVQKFWSDQIEIITAREVKNIINENVDKYIAWEKSGWVYRDDSVDVIRDKAKKIRAEISALEEKKSAILSRIDIESALPVRPTQSVATDVVPTPAAASSPSIGPVVIAPSRIDIPARQSLHSRSDTIDTGAQSRIDAEQGIGRQRLTEADLIGWWFRSKMDTLMRIDDATFQTELLAVQSRKWREWNRPHEAEMYESAAKIRKMSDADIVAHADDIIKGNRSFLGDHSAKKLDSNLRDSIAKTNRDIDKMNGELAALNKQRFAIVTGDRAGIDTLINKKEADIAMAKKHASTLQETQAKWVPMNDKALLVAENAALRSRLTDIIGKKDPAIPGLVQDAVNGKPGWLIEKLEKDKKLSPWLLLPLLALVLLLARCSGDDTPPLPENDPKTGAPSPAAVAKYCADCGEGETSIIDYSRRSEANNGVILTRKKRESLTQGFMKGAEWKKFMTDLPVIEKSLASSNHPLSPTLIKRVKDVILVPNVENVQDLQKCLKMFEKKSSGWPKINTIVTLDHQWAQDGILGPITLGKIREAISMCKVDTPVPKIDIPPTIPLPTPPRIPDDSGSWSEHSDPMGVSPYWIAA